MHPILTAALGFALFCSGSHAAETNDAVTIRVENASAKVGEQTVLVAKIEPRPGFQIADAYRNRVMKLTAEDEGVKFQSEVVRAALQDGSLLFKIGVTPTRPGEHAVNGIFRFAFVNVTDDTRSLDIKWAPLTAIVTGTQ